MPGRKPEICSVTTLLVATILAQRFNPLGLGSRCSYQWIPLTVVATQEQSTPCESAHGNHALDDLLEFIGRESDGVTLHAACSKRPLDDGVPLMS